MTRYTYPALFLLSLLCSCYKETGVPVNIDFSYKLPADLRTVPVNVAFSNLSTGASHYHWTFEGGEPAVSDYENPGTIRFKQAGTYTITLEAWNEDERRQKSLTIQLDSAVNINFDTLVLVNHFSPVEVQLTNKSIGGSTYDWTFEDGIPATFQGAAPPNVVFTTPGDHTIRLRVSNGGQEFVTEKKITVLPALTVDASWQYAFEDEDQEAPLTAMLHGSAANFLTQQWKAGGGTIKNDTAGNTSIYFKDPGTYEVIYQAANGKDTKSVTRTITVKPNSFISILRDIKLGINAAHGTVGSFYAIRHRRVYKKDEDITIAGKDIDLVFFGLSATFGFNKFISPDSATAFSFPLIPGATRTRYVNTTETCGCGISLTTTDFDKIQNDDLFKQFHITDQMNGGVQFNNTLLPRIVPFETADGRRGAIKIKQYVADGINSYVIVDIKVQKYE
ncbi:PKD domain-containing protein [Chitinophaga jiangningensis]|uniref:PKD domain-containing protein n=1 Tax=Chitinophaga jiangningensis TaxID=1419482 RepID=A0A1M7L751_9BACT|nr:PKD domain-containing protein [Chitinophaga jiangningensis]SHM73719.1 PKD domain-containing protein [Chitinophaga jiangningensis]